MSNDPIDAVICWVDGNDPKLNVKRQKFMNSSMPSKGVSTRFANCWEIYYCVASILKFGTFFRKIYIVTDQQVPDILEQLDVAFPSFDKSRIEIVDHTDIFKNHLDVLPVFNSTAIATMLFNIPALSKKFVYFNDDVFLLKPVVATDFFKEDRPVLRGKKQRRWIVRLRKKLRSFVKKKTGVKIFNRVSFKEYQVNGADMVNDDPHYHWHDHTPHPVCRKRMASFFEANPEFLRKNIKHRFRSSDNFGVLGLLHALEIQEGNYNFENCDLVYFNSQTRKNHQAYFERKVAYSLKRDLKFACVQSLDLVKTEVRANFFAWLANKIGVPVFEENITEKQETVKIKCK